MQNIIIVFAIIFIAFAGWIADGDSAVTIEKNSQPIANKKKIAKYRIHHGQIRRECKNFKSREMKVLCNRLATDPTIRKMGTDCRGYANVSKAEAFLDRQTRASSRSGINLAPDPFIIDPPTSGNIPIGFQCSKTCPDYSSSPPINISPYESCLHYDPLRFPQWLKLGFCSCEGCINYKTGKEDLSFRSVAIVAHLTVIVRKPTISFDECKSPSTDCWEEKLEMSMGCHCIMPRA